MTYIAPIFEATAETYEHEVVKCDLPVMLIYYSNTCGSCHELFNRIQNQYLQAFNGRVKFVKIQLTEAMKVGKYLRSDSGTPRSFFMKRGKFLRHPDFNKYDHLVYDNKRDDRYSMIGTPADGTNYLNDFIKGGLVFFHTSKEDGTFEGQLPRPL